jgi:chromosome segregation ATPase
MDTAMDTAMDMDATERDRVSDYLDDKLQTAAELDTGNLDALLARITEQQALLRQQVNAAQRDLHDAKQDAHAHHAHVQTQATAFRRAQADIDRRLLVITASDASEDAVPRFEAALGQLHRLDVASSYVQLLGDVDVLRYHCQRAVPPAAC